MEGLEMPFHRSGQSGRGLEFFLPLSEKKGEFLGKLLNLPIGWDFGWGSQRGKG
jgi:hypothetical protein